MFSDSITDNNNAPIIRRQARNNTRETNSSPVDDRYADIYYKRRTNAANYDIYSDMIIKFSCDDSDNTLGTDYDIYSTLDDALRNENEWFYCDERYCD